MLSQESRASTERVGSIKNWADNASINRVIEFIEKNIGLYLLKYTDVVVEKDLTQNFSLCMNRKAKNELFTFSNGYKDTILATPYEVDLGVVSDDETESFFVLEAKRLDTTLPTSREKEYIIGKIDGIERFKKEKHGKNLAYVGMLGYVQSDDFDTWHRKINHWIDEEISSATSSELTWDANDKLLINKKETIYQTYVSKHKCLVKDIEMYHIWVDLTT